MNSTLPKKNGWLVDSGASHHFTPDITDFDTLEDDDTEVSLGDSITCQNHSEGHSQAES
jgi:hypothetical protein